MMDLMMIAVLLGGFGLVWGLVQWCQRQLDAQE